MDIQPQPLTIDMQPCWVLEAGTSVRAGFPTPAEDHSAPPLDLSQRLVTNPLSTFFMRVSGYSMQDAGIMDGDYLIVDRSVRPEHGHIVVAVVNGEFSLKFLHTRGGKFMLKAANPAFLPIIPKEGTSVEVWGVARTVFKALPGFKI